MTLTYCLRLDRRIWSIVLLGLIGLAAIPAQAKELKGKVGLTVRDAVSGRPLSGVSLQLTAIVMKRKSIASQPVEERIPVDGNTATTNADGFALANVHIGETSGSTKRLETNRVVVSATLPGYKPVADVGRVDYAMFDPPRLVLDDLRLAPAGSAVESSFEPQLLRPEARVTPESGDDRSDFTVHVRVHFPRSMLLVLKEAGKRSYDEILHVFVQETDGTIGADPKRTNRGYRKDLIELVTTGAPIDPASDAVDYSGVIRHPSEDDGTAIDHLHLAIRAAEPSDTLMTAEGDHVLFTESKTRGNLLLGQERRWNTVLLTVMSVPVRWAVGKSVELARKAYDRKFAAVPGS